MTAATRTQRTSHAREGVVYLSLDDVVARYANAYSKWTLREKARRGEIPHLRHPGAKCLLFRADWLDLWDDGAALERRVARQRGLSAGRIVSPKGAASVPARRLSLVSSEVSG